MMNAAAQTNKPYPETWYAPETPESVLRAAILGVAKKVGHESLFVNPVAEDRTDRAIVTELLAERTPLGSNRHGRSWIVTVKPDGRTIVRQER